MVMKINFFDHFEWYDGTQCAIFRKPPADREKNIKTSEIIRFYFRNMLFDTQIGREK